jgi:hypothetical protein
MPHEFSGALIAFVITCLPTVSRTNHGRLSGTAVGISPMRPNSIRQQNQGHLDRSDITARINQTDPRS